MSSDSPFSAADLTQLEAIGISGEEAHRQIELLNSTPSPVRLGRPATIGDGIRRISHGEHGTLIDHWHQAAAAGRLLKFVPASGAASRMFRTLRGFLNEEARPMGELRRRAENGDGVAAHLVTFVDELSQFALAVPLSAACAARGLDFDELVRRGNYSPLLEVLLTAEGLDYGELPKALIPFHRYESESRTAFEEHLVEGRLYLRQGQGPSRFHFTVAAAHESEFEQALATFRERWDTGIDVRFSTQHPSTDTLAVDLEGAPFRLEDGRLLVRPGGHGSLLRNLQELGGDIVLVKNIDNVVREPLQLEVALWKRLLVGLTVSLERQVARILSQLDAGEEGAARAGLEFIRDELGDRAAETMANGEQMELAAAVRHRLARPLRVCGVVLNEGEPGGGPFWSLDAKGEASLQIVEAAEVDLDAPGQRQIWSSATHFNPVDLVLSLRDPAGNAYDLGRFTDEARIFVARKTHAGRPLLALERPGLWNGGMAHWNTVFVEVPAETFAPVKTVLDLLRPSHRASA